jgi:CPA2 family monovalent cation:H+ antiporter-2
MSDFLLLALIFLSAGVLFVPIASRLGLGSVLGYLIAGIAISPLLTALHVDVVAVQHFAEFGVVMMLFLVGLELEPKRIWQMRTRLLGLGGAQVAGTAALLAAASMALGQSWQMSLAIGLVLALSSTAIVLQTFNEKGLMRSDGGEAGFSVLLFQDIAVIPMLAFMPLLASPDLIDAISAAAAELPANEDHGSSWNLVADLNAWQTMLATVAAMAAVVLGGGFLTRPLFRFVAGAKIRELFTVTALFIVIGIAFLMTAVGLSPALGTFLAGVVLATSEYRHELESDIDPFRGLLLGLFFITVGASIDFGLLSENLVATLGLAFGLILLKAAVLFVLGWLFKIQGSQRWLLALGLAQAGEFGFVLLSFTVANGILPTAIADQLLLIVALSMLVTPLLFILFDRVVSPHFSRSQETPADEIEQKNPIIIAGRGRIGGIVEHMLRSAGYAATVIDYSSRHLDLLRRFGIKAYFGDATRPDLLHSAGIEEARLLIVAIDDKQQITELVDYAIRNFPKLHVIARAVDRHHVYHLWALGCRDIIRETYDSSLRIGRSAYEALGVSRETADRMKAEFDETNRRAMIEVADAYDVNIPAYENEAYIQKVRSVIETWDTELTEKIVAIRKSQSSPDRPG